MEDVVGDTLMIGFGGLGGIDFPDTVYYELMKRKNGILARSERVEGRWGEMIGMM